MWCKNGLDVSVAGIVGLWCWFRNGYGGLKLEREDIAFHTNLYQVYNGFEAFFKVVGKC